MRSSGISQLDVPMHGMLASLEKLERSLGSEGARQQPCTKGTTAEILRFRKAIAMLVSARNDTVTQSAGMATRRTHGLDAA
jgi:hypothetical protein